MPDISMCKNTQCPMRYRCYRFAAIPSRRQSYASFAPDASGVCVAFDPIRPADKIQLEVCDAP